GARGIGPLVSKRLAVMLGPLPSALCSLGRKSPLLTYDSGRTEYKSGFAATIRLTRASISALTGGRPPVGPAESLVQYSRKRRRCHRRTVVGVTITRGRRPSGPDSGEHDPEEPISSA